MNPDPSPGQVPTLAESQHKTEHKQTVKSGRGYILAIAILQLLAGMLFFGVFSFAEEGGKNPAFLNLAVTVSALGIVYLGLWMWAKRAPFAAALVALILYVSLLALDAVMQPEAIARGIIIKVLIIAGLTKAVSSGHALKKASEAAASES